MCTYVGALVCVSVCTWKNRDRDRHGGERVRMHFRTGFPLTHCIFYSINIGM